MRIVVLVGRCLLQDLLDSRGMTRHQLSDLTGKSVTQISDYINGNRKTMSLSNAKIFATVLKCHIDDLYEWKIKE